MFLCACELNGGMVLGAFIISFSFFPFSLVFWKLSGDMVVLLLVAATATIRAISKQRTNLLHE